MEKKGPVKITLAFEGVSSSEKSAYAQELGKFLLRKGLVKDAKPVRESPETQDAGTAILLTLEVGVVAYHLYHALTDFVERERMRKATLEVGVSADIESGKVLFVKPKDGSQRFRFEELLQSLGLVPATPKQESTDRDEPEA
jgi:hypothetical protein